MKRKTAATIAAFVAVLATGFARAQTPVEAKLPPVPDPALSQTQPQVQPTVVAPELLIGHWDINVDSFLDTRLQLEGKTHEHPAKIEQARNLLKSNGASVSFDFRPDGSVTVAKAVGGVSEIKSGTWAVVGVKGRRMLVDIRSADGRKRRWLEVAVCDDLRIRVLAPIDIAGIYDRAPVAIREIVPENRPGEKTAVDRNVTDEVAP